MKLLSLIFLLILISPVFAQDRQYPKRNQKSAIPKKQFQNPDGPPGTLALFPRMVWRTNSASVTTLAGEEKASETHLGFKADLIFPIHRYITLRVNYFYLPSTLELSQNLPEFKLSQREIEVGFKFYIW